MSAYITLATPMVDEDCLIEAIVELGFDRSALVRSDTPIALRGWQQGRSAHIVLPKDRTGDTFNDIGFFKGPAGYVAVLSDDHAVYGRAWLARVGDRYKAHWNAKQARLAEADRLRIEEERRHLVEAQRVAVHERAKKLGYMVKEAREGDKIRLVLVKRSY
jgi:hypothetical protein